LAQKDVENLKVYPLVQKL